MEWAAALILDLIDKKWPAGELDVRFRDANRDFGAKFSKIALELAFLGCDFFYKLVSMDSTDESEPRKGERNKEELANAFPLAIRQDALVAISALSENRFSSRWQTFSMRLGHELLTLPQRICYAPPLLQTLRFNALQTEILNCLFTRHHDGFVRQARLGRIIRSQKAWIPCFVVPLVGEYVADILQVICENLNYLDKSIYTEFVRSNLEFMNLTEQRVISYWDCYYRSIKKQDYRGFLILDFLRSLTESATR